MQNSENSEKIMQVKQLFNLHVIRNLQNILQKFEVEITNYELTKLIESQTKKGLEKYGKTILDCDYNEHDWAVMATEELIDFYLYTLKNKKLI